MAGLHASHAAERQGLSPVRAAWGAARVRLGAPNAAADWRAVGRVCRPGPGALGPGQDPLTRGGGPSRSRSTPALSAGLKPTWPRAPPSLPPPRESAAATARSQGGGPAEMSSQHLRRGRALCPLPFTSGRGPQVSGKHRQDGRRAQRREGAPGGAERVLSPARREHFTFSLARPRAPPGRLPSPPPQPGTLGVTDLGKGARVPFKSRQRQTRTMATSRCGKGGRVEKTKKKSETQPCRSLSFFFPILFVGFFPILFAPAVVNLQPDLTDLAPSKRPHKVRHRPPPPHIRLGGQAEPRHHGQPPVLHLRHL